MNITEIYRRFPTEADCITYLEQFRWRGIPICPYCKKARITPMPKEHRYHCNSCKTTFSVFVDTVFQHTRLPLQKWFLALALLLSTNKVIATRPLAKSLEVNRNTAWRVTTEIEKAMYQPEQRKFLQRLAGSILDVESGV